MKLATCILVSGILLGAVNACADPTIQVRFNPSIFPDNGATSVAVELKVVVSDKGSRFRTQAMNSNAFFDFCSSPIDNDSWVSWEAEIFCDVDDRQVRLHSELESVQEIVTSAQNTHTFAQKVNIPINDASSTFWAKVTFETTRNGKPLARMYGAEKLIRKCSPASGKATKVSCEFGTPTAFAIRAIKTNPIKPPPHP